MNRELLITIGKACASLFLIANYGLILSGVMYKIVARVHGRFGPPVWQPYINLAKLLTMRTAVTHGIMFYLGPVFRITGGVGLYLLIPAVYGSSWFGNFSFAGDIILVMYFIFFGMLGMALGAAESGHPYSAIGVMRGLAQNTASELPFVLAVLSLVAQYKTLSVTGMVAAQQGGFANWTLFTNPLAVIAAMLAFIGMMHRSPFDVHLAPQEIPVGPPTEFHSSYLFMMSFNRAFFGSAKLVLFANLFFGGATSIPELVSKTFLIMLWTVFVGAVFPRYRLEQSVRWLLTVPTLIGVLALALQMFKG